MNVIVGVLLFFMNEEHSFWTLAAIVEDLLPEYFTKSMLGVLGIIHLMSRHVIT
jgi:hypothetical protein